MKCKSAMKNWNASRCHRRRVPVLMMVLIVFIELSLLTNVAHCLQSFVIYWNTTNPM